MEIIFHRKRCISDTSNFQWIPSWNGRIYAVEASDGSLVWEKNMQEMTGINNGTGFVLKADWTMARATPTIAEDEDLLFIGIYGPAVVVVAVKRSNGELLWSSMIDNIPASVITMSGTYFKGFATLTFTFVFYLLIGVKSIYFSPNKCNFTEVAFNQFKST